VSWSRLRGVDRRLLPPLAATGQRLAGTPGRRRGLAAAGLAVVLVALVTVAWAGARGSGADAGGSVAEVGAAPGEPPAAYQERARARLASLLDRAGGESADETYALVVFDRHLTPGELTPVLSRVATSAVFVSAGDSGAYRLVAHRIPDDVTARMATLASRLEGAEATAYAAGCACVYAAVVRADPAGLAEIAQLDQVWVVDPALEVTRLDRVDFRPPPPP
jgi:hypothetical protein